MFVVAIIRTGVVTDAARRTRYSEEKEAGQESRRRFVDEPLRRRRLSLPDPRRESAPPPEPRTRPPSR